VGLAPVHHRELNSWLCPSYRYDELREVYATDRVAQQQIDVYDPDTAYHTHIRRFRDAVRDGNADVEAKEHKWLKQYYPDVTQ